MTRNRILASIATIAIVAAAPSIAKPGGGGGGGQGHGNAGANAGAMGGGMGGGMGSGMGRGGGAGGMGGGADISTGVNSGLDAGSTTRIRGSDRSSVSTSTRGMGNVDLSGITDGMTVVDSTGATVGTVTDINTAGRSDRIRSVEVTLTGGDVITLSPRSLSVDGDVLTTTSVATNVGSANARINSQGPAHANINGLVNASPNSVLAGAGVTTLTGLTTGLTVNNSAGTSIGTVTEVLTNRSGAVVGIRVDLTGDGGIVFIPATTLTIDGTIVTTSSTSF